MGTSKLPYPYKAAQWRAIDDRVRGGSSTSAFNVSAEGRRAEFSGVLDTSTLGGAGFASQACEFDHLDLSRFIGLRLALLQASQGSVRSDKAHCTSFTLNLKTALPEKRPDGRLESRLSFEGHFEHDSQDKSRILELPWSAFEPYYRGRPQRGQKLDPARITEISIMCRSNFDAQSGPFRLFLGELSGIERRSWWSRLLEWFSRIRSVLPGSL